MSSARDTVADELFSKYDFWGWFSSLRSTIDPKFNELVHKRLGSKGGGEGGVRGKNKGS